MIEGAGGLMVPLGGDTLYIDVFERWRLPAVLCASTALGTMNHTLLSIKALRKREICILGTAFIGEKMLRRRLLFARLGGCVGSGDCPCFLP